MEENPIFTLGFEGAADLAVKGAENRFNGGFSKNWRLKLRGHLSFLFLHPSGCIAEVSGGLSLR